MCLVIRNFNSYQCTLTLPKITNRTSLIPYIPIISHEYKGEVQTFRYTES